MDKSQLGRQVTMFVMLFIIFALATGNIAGTLIGCLVNAVIYQWTAGVMANANQQKR